MKKLETIVTLIQKPTEVEFTCPYCKSDVSEDFEEFLDEQGLSWSDFPDWEYEPIKCPFCENEIEAEYEFDWGGGMKYKELEKVAIKSLYTIRRIGVNTIIECESLICNQINRIIIDETQEDTIDIDVLAFHPNDLEVLTSALAMQKHRLIADKMKRNII